MPASEPTPEYEPRYFEADKTAAEYEARYKSPATKGYDKWMCSRRAGDFNSFASAQRRRIHYVAAGGMGFTPAVYCCCGLKVSLPQFNNYDDLPARGLDVPGHRDHLTNTPAQVFVLHDRLVCAGCDLNEPVDFDHEEHWKKKPLVDWDAVLAAHADCGFSRL